MTHFFKVCWAWTSSWVVLLHHLSINFWGQFAGGNTAECGSSMSTPASTLGSCSHCDTWSLGDASVHQFVWSNVSSVSCMDLYCVKLHRIVQLTSSFFKVSLVCVIVLFSIFINVNLLSSVWVNRFKSVLSSWRYAIIREKTMEWKSGDRKEL